MEELIKQPELQENKKQEDKEIKKDFCFLYYYKNKDNVYIFYSNEFVKRTNEHLIFKNSFYKGEITEKIFNREELIVNYKIKGEREEKFLLSETNSLFIENIPVEEWMSIESKVAYKKFEESKIDLLLKYNEEMKSSR